MCKSLFKSKRANVRIQELIEERLFLFILEKSFADFDFDKDFFIEEQTTQDTFLFMYQKKTHFSKNTFYKNDLTNILKKSLI